MTRNHESGLIPAGYKTKNPKLIKLLDQSEALAKRADTLWSRTIRNLNGYAKVKAKLQRLARTIHKTMEEEQRR